VARTLGHPDGSAAGLGGAWLEALPPTVVETDALLLMARARRAVASGALAEAVATMRAAEAVAASSTVAPSAAGCERDQVAAWTESETDRSGPTGSAVLRGATQRHPKEAQRVAASLPGATGRFAEGAAAFLAGDMLSASRILRGVVAHPDAAPTLAAGARVMATVAGHCAVASRMTRIWTGFATRSRRPASRGWIAWPGSPSYRPRSTRPTCWTT
jgi:hypothetical protein